MANEIVIESRLPLEMEQHANATHRPSPILGAFVFRLTECMPCQFGSAPYATSVGRPGSHDWETAESRSKNGAKGNRKGSVEFTRE